MSLRASRHYLILFAGSPASVSGGTSDDITADAFDLGAEFNATRNQDYLSSIITVAGLGTGISVVASIMSDSTPAATYSKNGGAFTSSLGTATNGDQFQVKLHSSSSYSTTVFAALGIGSVTDAFTVSTENDPGSPTVGGVIDFSEEDATLNPLFI